MATGNSGCGGGRRQPARQSKRSSQASRKRSLALLKNGSMIGPADGQRVDRKIAIAVERQQDARIGRTAGWQAAQVPP